MFAPSNTWFLTVVRWCFFIFFIGCFLSSCAPKKEGGFLSRAGSVAYGPQASLIEQFKDINIPIPINFKYVETRYSHEVNNNLVVHRYEGSLSLKKVIDFYRRELEVNGWVFSDFSTEREGLFFGHKESQECGISIRRTHKTTIFFHVRTKGVRSREANNMVNTDIINKKMMRVI